MNASLPPATMIVCITSDPDLSRVRFPDNSAWVTLKVDAEDLKLSAKDFFERYMEPALRRVGFQPH